MSAAPILSRMLVMTIVALASAALLLGGHSRVADASDSGNCSLKTKEYCGDTHGGSLNYYYSATDRAFYGLPGQDRGSQHGRAYEFRYAPLCTVDYGAGLRCEPQECQVGGGPGVRMLIYRRIAGSGDRWSGPVADGCIGSANTVPLREVEQAAEEELHKALDQPRIHTQPGPRALIQLPVLFWTTDRGPVTLHIDEPVPGTVRAEPTYTWAFPGGHTATGTGRPYDGTDPRTDPDHYLVHTYDHTGPGAATLVVDYDATIDVPPNPTVPLDPVTLTTTTTLHLVETTNLLSGS